MNRPPSGNNYRVMGLYSKMLEVYPQSIPNKTVRVSAGSYWRNGTTFVEFSESNTPEISFPTAGARWVVVTLSGSSISLVYGDQSTTQPSFPVINNTLLPLAAIYLKSIDVSVTRDMIYDIRPIYPTGVTPVNHSELLNRNSNDAHSISSITGLSDALASKATPSDITTAISSLSGTLVPLIDTKCSNVGTENSSFSLNKDETGVPSSDVELSVVRGNEPSVGIRWNETLDRWQFTNNGSEYLDLGSGQAAQPNDASTLSKGVVKLSQAPEASNNPIAVGDNDTRLLTTQNKTDLLAHLAATPSDPHNTLSLLTSQNLPSHTHPVVESSSTVIGSVKLSLDPVASNNPVAVGDNDSRLLTPTQKSNLVSHLGAVGSVHGLVSDSVDGFMSSSDKIKLDGVEAGANNYSHPATHSPSIIEQDANNRFVTDNQITSWSSKQASLGFIPEDSANKNTANGYVGLDANSKISSSQLPSVDWSLLTSIPSTIAEYGITDAVNTNDARLLTTQNKTDLLSHLAAISSDVHGVLGLIPITELSSIILVDTQVPANKYRIEVISGVLTATLIS